MNQIEEGLTRFTFQVPIADIAHLTGLKPHALPAADRLHRIPAHATINEVPVGWVKLRGYSDVNWSSGGPERPGL